MCKIRNFWIVDWSNSGMDERTSHKEFEMKWRQNVFSFELLYFFWFIFRIFLQFFNMFLKTLIPNIYIYIYEFLLLNLILI